MDGTFLPLADYQRTLDSQHTLVEERFQEKIPDTVLLVEHEPVVTLGRRADREHVLVSEEALSAAGVRLHETDRGGEVTYHGPGQLVVYPIINLRPDRCDLRRYIRNLEEVVIRSLGRWGLEGKRIEGRTGVWVEDRKIAAIGVRVSRWVTCHGFALNYDVDLGNFQRIVPCGITDAGVTSVDRELPAEKRPDPEAVMRTIEEELRGVFGSGLRLIRWGRRNTTADGFRKRADRPLKRPDWIRVPFRLNKAYTRVRGLIDSLELHTVCEEAHCPNIFECWSRGTATYMILGDICTRRCTFCAVGKGDPGKVDPEEPSRVGEAVKKLSLKHAVITSVNRDDLPHGGASQFVATIRAVREHQPGCTVEVLIPDFEGNWDALEQVIAERPEVLSHNVETVPRLYRRVRPYADYRQSLDLLRRAVRPELGFRVKSGIMVGLGESFSEIRDTLADVRSTGCHVVTVGQYLAPTRDQHLPIERYVTPKEFDEIRDYGISLGFDHVESGPLVRSSYHAETHVHPSMANANPVNAPGPAPQA